MMMQLFCKSQAQIQDFANLKCKYRILQISSANTEFCKSQAQIQDFPNLKCKYTILQISSTNTEFCKSQAQIQEFANLKCKYRILQISSSNIGFCKSQVQIQDFANLKFKYRITHKGRKETMLTKQSTDQFCLENSLNNEHYRQRGRGYIYIYMSHSHLSLKSNILWATLILESQNNMISELFRKITKFLGILPFLQSKGLTS